MYLTELLTSQHTYETACSYGTVTVDLRPDIDCVKNDDWKAHRSVSWQKSMKIEKHKKLKKKVGMMNPMRDKNEGMCRGGGRGVRKGTCYHGLSRRSLRVEVVTG